MRNPHFDDDRIIWKDEYSGEYQPIAYEEQFDDQWRLFLEKQPGFHKHSGVETQDKWIDARICELTGVRDVLLKRKWGALAPLVKIYRQLKGITQQRLDIGGRLLLEPQFPIDFVKDKRCLDVGCGAGRWTKVLTELGGNVTSIDVSPHALKSVKRFTEDVRRGSLFDIPTLSPPLTNSYDFVICWGVIMCTHDPKKAFEHVASAVKPGGSLYIMVYAPTYHISDEVVNWRKDFHKTCKTFEDKLDFAYSIAVDKRNAINYLDMLNTFYNWVIQEETVLKWYEDAGFVDTKILNKHELKNCGWHVVGRKA